MWSLLVALLWAAPLDQPARAGVGASDLAPPVKLISEGKPIDVDVGHAAPWVADLKGDGGKQLLVGQFGEGKVRIFPISGAKKAPRLEKFEWLQAGGSIAKVPTG